MSLLRWSFDWPVRRAVAVAHHGTYVIEGTAPHEWLATFTRLYAPGQAGRPLPGTSRSFVTMADAMHACRLHAEQFTSESSDRLSAATPVP
jgi:hypothetical protein